MGSYTVLMGQVAVPLRHSWLAGQVVHWLSPSSPASGLTLRGTPARLLGLALVALGLSFFASYQAALYQSPPRRWVVAGRVSTGVAVALVVASFLVNRPGP
jgi:hypothetical protein